MHDRDHPIRFLSSFSKIIPMMKKLTSALLMLLLFGFVLVWPASAEGPNYDPPVEKLPCEQGLLVNRNCIDLGPDPYRDRLAAQGISY